MKEVRRLSFPKTILWWQLLAVTWLFVMWAGPAVVCQSDSPGSRGQLVLSYGNIPLAFERNVGQADGSVRFLHRSRDGAVFFTEKEAVFTGCQEVSGRWHVRWQVSNPGKPGGCDVVRIGWERADSRAQAAGEERLAGTVNYFVGADPGRWHAGVPRYARVRYTEIYPGIDLVFYGNERELEFDLIVAPGADPRRLRLRLSGERKVRLTPNGDAVVMTASGALALHKPVAYQVTNGRRQAVAGRFVLLNRHTLGLRMGRFDRRRTLVIDPALAYSTFLGGSMAGDAGNAIAVDAAGNVYIAGVTSSTSFPVTPGAYQGTSHAGSAGQTVFVSKLNGSGTALLYSSYLGGSGGDVARTIAVDSSGNAYVAGYTLSTDFPVTQGAMQTTNRAATGGNPNAFVSKLSADGASLLYSTYLGGSGEPAWFPYGGDSANAIAVDSAGDAYVTGRAYSADFPVTQGAFQTTNKGAGNPSGISNAFITALNPTGTAALYSTYLGGSGGSGALNGEAGNAITVDASGDAYVGGQTPSSNFPVTSGAFQTTLHSTYGTGGYNAFVTELNATGSALAYSTYLGGSNIDVASAMAVDAAGNAYVAGQTISPDFPVTQGAVQTTYKGTTYQTPNGFVAKLNASGTGLGFSTFLGGRGGIVNVSPTLFHTGGDQVSGLAIAHTGDVFVAGSTASSDFPVTQSAYQSTNNDQSGCAGCYIGGYNAFLTELNSAGNALAYSTYLGGNGINPNDFVGITTFGDGDLANGLALDGSGNVYVAGAACSYDFPVTSGVFQTAVVSRGSAFVAKFTMSGSSSATTPTVTVTPAAATITSALPLNVTISVAGPSGGATPTGTVTLASGSYSSAADTLSGGSVTISVPAGLLLAEPPLPPDYSIDSVAPDLLVANYLPDAASSSTYNSASGTASVRVVAPYIAVTPSSTTLTWAQSQSHPLPVAINAFGATGTPVPGGTVALTTGNYSSAPASLSGGAASISIPAGVLTTGLNVLNASYSGDSNYGSYGGAAIVIVGSVTVSVVPTATSINSSQALPVTITVSAVGGGPTPTGSVRLTSGNYSSSTTLTNGSATITIPGATLPGGVDVLEADYFDGNYIGASGTATVTVSGFTITATSVTIKAGATTGNTATISVMPFVGFTGSVALSAAITTGPVGGQDPPTFSFGSTSPVNISGTNPGTATLTITTTASGGCPSSQFIGSTQWHTGGAALVCFSFLCILGGRRKKRTGRRALAVVMAMAVNMVACGGSGKATCSVATSGTTLGTYTITVTGTSGMSVSSGIFNLTVQ